MFPYRCLPVSLVPLVFFLCPTPGCRTCRDPDVEYAETRVLNMSRPGCHTMSFRISVFSISLLLFSFARMRIYYNVFLFSSLSPLCLYSRKICSSICLSISVLRKSFHIPCKKSPYIFGAYIIKSYFCTRFREREQRCFDILTGTA